MVIVKNPAWNKWNSLPKTKIEEKWYEEHLKKLETAQNESICPECNRKLLKDQLLFDQGYKYGLECEFCR